MKLLTGVIRMNSRKLKTYYNKDIRPQIILQGKWLEDLGYKIGDKIEVNLTKDKITIKKEP